MVRITETTGVTLSLVVGLCGIIGSAMWWASGVQSATASAVEKSIAVEANYVELRSSNEELRRLAASTDAKVSILVEFFRADEVGPPKRYRRR